MVSAHLDRSGSPISRSLLLLWLIARSCVGRCKRRRTTGAAPGGSRLTRSVQWHVLFGLVCVCSWRVWWWRPLKFLTFFAFQKHLKHFADQFGEVVPIVGNLALVLLRLQAVKYDDTILPNYRQFERLAKIFHNLLYNTHLWLLCHMPRPTWLWHRRPIHLCRCPILAWKLLLCWVPRPDCSLTTRRSCCRLLLIAAWRVCCRGIAATTCSWHTCLP